jgi:hypothetical protein
MTHDGKGPSVTTVFKTAEIKKKLNASENNKR